MNIFLEETKYKDSYQVFSLKKNPTKEYNCFQIDCHIINPDGTQELAGYMYFNISKEDNSSSYIGTYIKPKYRKEGFAKKMVSAWIKFCLNNNIENLKTTRHQRKPLLLYILKEFSFEIKDKSIYQGKSIHICEKEKTKALLFDDSKAKSLFLKSKIYLLDKIPIIDNMGEYSELDKIILNHKYYLEDKEYAYEKVKMLSKGE